MEFWLNKSENIYFIISYKLCYNLPFPVNTLFALCKYSNVEIFTAIFTYIVL